MSPSETVRMLVIESAGPVETPNRYRNRFGQLMEHSPFCERDIQAPQLQEPINNKNECRVKVKTLHGIQEYTYAHHPCDVVGWDGYYFPWKISIHDFEPIVGSIHQPPPVHQTFQGRDLSFVLLCPVYLIFIPIQFLRPIPILMWILMKSFIIPEGIL